MWHRAWMGLAVVFASVALARGAGAHVKLTYPPQRGGPADPNQKEGPCGNNGPRSDITYLEAGAKIVVEWDETIDHPGHFRISFDDDGTDFVDPTGYDDFTTDPATLLANTADGGGAKFSQEITLPDIECDNCTLQLIQVMTDKPPWGPAGGNELYYRCADLVLTKPASTTTSGSGSSSTGQGGSSGSGAGGSGSGSGAGGSGGAGGAGGATTTSPGGGASSGDGGCAIGGHEGGGWAAGGVILAALLGARRGRARSRRRGG